MKRILKAQKILNLKNYKNCIINYYITFETSNNNKYIYGIEIIKYKGENNFFKLIETECITNITYNCKAINNLLNIMSNNFVTPVTLQYILDDIIETIPLE